MENNIPKKKIKTSNIIKKSAEELTEFDLLPIRMDGTIIGPNGEMIVVLASEGKQVAYVLNSIETTMITYLQAGCNTNPHIKTIYQIYIDTMQGLGNKLITAVIETKAGDMMYGRLKWENSRGENFFLKCSIGDVLILSAMTKCNLLIVRKVLDDMDEFKMDYRDDAYI